MFLLSTKTFKCTFSLSRASWFKTSYTFPCCQSTLAAAGAIDPVEYCTNFVQKYDYEAYLIGQFWPKEVRGPYFALKAFSTELAMIQDNVSNSSIGMMRMQFWRDATKALNDGNPPAHPIALALHQASIKANLPTYHFKRIIDARDAELQAPVHLTVESLTAHSESTSSTVLYLLLSLLSLPSSTLSHAASHLGAAQTFTTLLRALPFHAKNGRMVLPAEITAKHGVVQEDVFRRGPAAKGLDDAVFEFATVANDHLVTARSMFHQEGFGGKVPWEAMPVFLAGVPVSSILKQVEEVNFDVFHPRMQTRDWRLPWRIWKGYYQRMF
ncbi:isoprenoid synthase domain-containing protein [Lentinula edodes]|nr:isoprenoid synthase domain-containing protein [Lentinula edodes]